ncbi:type III pantothenate kinase [Thalassotalea euphylliae]|uniref:type III pantothenate kinase n=1 Tax=Thalassotalea euphylliae TaxID=1655234 RepID=UPI003639FC72
MNLLIDVGNTRAKYCLFEQQTLSEIETIASDAINPAWLKRRFAHVQSVVMANVGNKALNELVNEWCDSCNIPFTLALSEAERFGVISGYDNPRQLGVDRWLTLLACYQLFPQQACLIVDVGTATTVDYLDKSGVHHGGWILPGIDMMLDAVTAKAVDVHGQRSSIQALSLGTNTNDNINAAAMAATVGLVEQAESTIEKKGHQVEQVILTGGNGSIVSQLLDREHALIPQLVFYGLSRYC